MNLKKHQDEIFLSAILVAMLFAVAYPLGNMLVHDQPFNYGASDAFHNLIVANILKDSGSLTLYPSYYANNYEDLIAFNPPVLISVSVIFSQISGLPLWDALFFLIVFSTLIAILAMFLLIRKHFSNTLAYLSISFAFFLFTGPYFSMFTWGLWDYVLASIFLIIMFYFIDEPFFAILLMIAIIHTHTSEFIFAIGFIGLYILSKRFKNLKEQSMNIIISIVLSSYFLWIFYNTWMQTASFSFHMSFAKDVSGINIISFEQFGWIFGILVILGILFVLFNKKLNIASLAGLYMLLIGYTNLIGFDVRAFQTRYFWPLYLAVFFGYPFYVIFQHIKKYEYAIPFLSCMAFIILLIFHPVRISGGMLLPERWDVIKWTEQNTNSTDKLLYFYSDDINQAAMLFMAKRPPYIMEAKDFYGWVNNGTQRYASIRLIGEGKSNYAYWDGLRIDHHWDEMNQTDKRIMDICDFDYYFFSGYNVNQKLSKLHNSIMIDLLSYDTQLVYHGRGIIVIRNLAKGGECLG